MRLLCLVVGSCRSGINLLPKIWNVSVHANNESQSMTCPESSVAVRVSEAWLCTRLFLHAETMPFPAAPLPVYDFEQQQAALTISNDSLQLLNLQLAEFYDSLLNSKLASLQLIPSMHTSTGGCAGVCRKQISCETHVHNPCTSRPLSQQRSKLCNYTLGKRFLDIA